MALNKSLRNVSRRIRFRVISANQRSICLGQENWSAAIADITLLHENVLYEVCYAHGRG